MTALISQHLNSVHLNVVITLTAVLSLLLFKYANFQDLVKNSGDLWLLLLHSRFTKAFIASFSVIMFSELGDKTFFVSAIMAMKNPRLTVFFATMTACFINNALSVFIGLIATVVPKYITNYVSIALFAFFGIKMIYESRTMSDQNEELKEAEKELKKLKNKRPTNGLRKIFLTYFSVVFLETFSLIFFAEWGDRSQISTVVLAARENPIGVLFGAFFGYAMCAIIAVLGGRFLGQIISIKTVTFIGGILFIIFAFIAFTMGDI